MAKGTQTASVGAVETLRRLRTPAALVSLGSTPVLTSANAAFAEAVGIDLSSIAGRHPLSWAEAQSAERARRAFDTASRIRSEWSGPLLALADGQQRSRAFSALLLPLFEDDGKARHALLRLSPADATRIPDAAERAASHASRRGQVAKDTSSARDGHARTMKALRIVSAMVNREAPLVRDRRGRTSLARLRERIGALAHILDVLSHDAAPPETRLASQIERLCNEAKDCARGLRAPSNIEFRISAEAITWQPDRMVMLLLIVHELVGNALRHAFPDGRAGTIDVRLYRVDDIVRLYVEDNGCGFQDDAFVKDTFGINMVEAMVRHAGGMIAFDNDGGGSVMVRLPFQ